MEYAPVGLTIALVLILCLIGGCDSSGDDDVLWIHTTLFGVTAELSITYPDGSTRQVSLGDNSVELKTSFGEGEQYQFVASPNAVAYIDSDVTVCTVSAAAVEAGAAAVNVVILTLNEKLVIECTLGGNWKQ